MLEFLEGASRGEEQLGYLRGSGVTLKDSYNGNVLLEEVGESQMGTSNRSRTYGMEEI